MARTPYRWYSITPYLLNPPVYAQLLRIQGGEYRPPAGCMGIYKPLPTFAAHFPTYGKAVVPIEMEH